MDAADELRDVIEELTPYCYAFNRKLQAVVNEEINYSIIKEDPQNRFVVKTSFELAKTVSNILKTPLFDDSGAVTRELRTLLRKNTSWRPNRRKPSKTPVPISARPRLRPNPCVLPAQEPRPSWTLPMSCGTSSKN